MQQTYKNPPVETSHVEIKGGGTTISIKLLGHDGKPLHDNNGAAILNIKYHVSQIRYNPFIPTPDNKTTRVPYRITSSYYQQAVEKTGLLNEQGEARVEVPDGMYAVTFPGLESNKKLLHVDVFDDGFKWITKQKSQMTGTFEVKAGGTCDVKVLDADLRKLPIVANKQGWKELAVLLEHWFNGNEKKIPSRSPQIKDYANPKADTFTMKWITQFPTPKKELNAILQFDSQGDTWARRYLTEKAKEALKDMLKRDGYWKKAKDNTAGTLHHFDYIQRSRDALNDIKKGKGSAPKQAEEQALKDYMLTYCDVTVIGFEEFLMDRVTTSTIELDSLKIKLDPLIAALNRFTLRIAVTGTLTRQEVFSFDSYHVAINSLGVYVRDSFDFDGYQPLGYWNFVDNKVAPHAKDAGPLAVEVSNESFNRWRKRHKKGGDFMVYSSDIMEVPLNPADSFTFGFTLD